MSPRSTDEKLEIEGLENQLDLLARIYKRGEDLAGTAGMMAIAALRLYAMHTSAAKAAVRAQQGVAEAVQAENRRRGAAD